MTKCIAWLLDVATGFSFVMAGTAMKGQWVSSCRPRHIALRLKFQAFLWRLPESLKPDPARLWAIPLEHLIVMDVNVRNRSEVSK